MKTYLLLFLKGVAMGAANVIPGVSGGTVAFITGIYERLIESLSKFDSQALHLFIRFKFKSLFERVNGNFLIVLAFGIFISILTFARFIEWAFFKHETITLSFFFGLILASIVGVGKQITKWNFLVFLMLILGISLASLVAFLPPAGANDSFLYLIFCGIVAICSMILPGLSGSYVLLLMGNYRLVLSAISAFDFGILIPVAVGCALGLVAFSKLLNYLFHSFKLPTLALMTGFVIGSLLIIWPWKITEYQEIEGKRKAIGYTWQLPELTTEIVLPLICILVGFILVWWMEKTNTSSTKN